jgi:hypothetical protein
MIRKVLLCVFSVFFVAAQAELPEEAKEQFCEDSQEIVNRIKCIHAVSSKALEEELRRLAEDDIELEVQKKIFFLVDKQNNLFNNELVDQKEYASYEEQIRLWREFEERAKKKETIEERLKLLEELRAQCGCGK